MALGWCFPDESAERALEYLAALEGYTILVPPTWKPEVANAILTGERRGRLRPPETRRFLALLDGLPIVEDSSRVHRIEALVSLGRDHGLSAYDASYLDTAMEHAALLASLDAKLIQAAERCGVTIFAA